MFFIVQYFLCPTVFNLKQNMYNWTKTNQSEKEGNKNADKNRWQSMTKNFVAYRLVIDYSLIIGNNQWLINWLPINYLLITHWFHWWHWCHRFVMPGFQATKNLSACPTYLCFGLFCKSFSYRVSEIHGNRKFWSFDVVLKL